MITKVKGLTVSITQSGIEVNSAWIKCTDQLPETDECVLGLSLDDKCDTHVYCITRCFNGTNGYYFSCARRVTQCYPTYWMKLPSLPEVKNED